MYHEKELTNLLLSGRHWYGENFYATTTQRFQFNVTDIDNSSPIRMNISFMASASDRRPQLQVNCNGMNIANTSFPLKYDNEAIEMNLDTAVFIPASNNLSVELAINRNEATVAGGYLNYIRLVLRRKLNMSATQLFFRDSQSVGEGRTAEFQITGGSATKHVWDITDINNVRRMPTTLSGNTISFSAATDSLREFVAFDTATDLLKPTFLDKNGKTDNQNLHGIENVDMIIVTHPNFMEAARELATLHSDRDGLKVEIVTAQQVYNEFSSGMQDPAAIRNFMKYLFEKPSSVKLKYLLLMGAGSYDNKSNKSNESTNYIVTYQSVNSWHKTNSYVSDDYFGILGDGEAMGTGKLAIGIGRLPVRTAEQAKEVVNKILRYMDASLSGDWHNIVGLIADDGDGNAHTNDSENLAKYINDNHRQYTVDKLYLDAFPRVATADGHRFPEVEQQLNNLINSGCLLVNYNGHGNTSGLSSARVVNLKNIEQWRNKLYPLFMAATCDFGRFDNDALSGGETMLLSPNGGSIATLASARLVYQDRNFEFNMSFFRELLNRAAADDNHRLGDVVRRAKNKTSDTSVNKLCFALLGDPALKLNIPDNSVQTVSINNKLVTEPLDTLKANSLVTVKGSIINADGNILDDFNGILHFSLFDKARERETYNHDNSANGAITYYTQTSTLYKGKTSVENGEFELSFIMPSKINYQYGFGKICYYAGSKDGRNASGSFCEVTVGGSVPGSGETEGPKIRLFMNDTLFRDGGITDQTPTLIAYLHGETGINTSDAGIGQQITAILSNDTSKVYILNRYYEAELDNYNKGVVNYRFNHLPVGNYKLWFTVYDLENNQSQASIRFRVTESAILKIDKLYNYPNPFTDNTRIYFEFNMPDTEMQVELQIFDLSGRLLRSMKQSLITEGYTSGEFQWDGHDAGGNRMNAGLYPYRIILTSERGQIVLQTAKMIIE